MEHRIEELYAGLAAGDGERMAACYTPDARFVDPVFGELVDGRVRDMWRMLTAGTDPIEVELADVEVSGTRGTAVWTARYRFGPDRRRVENRGVGTYEFVEDGRIVDHVDDFSFLRWARQALGPVGWLSPVLPTVRSRVTSRARAGLDRFTA